MFARARICSSPEKRTRPFSETTFCAPRVFISSAISFSSPKRQGITKFICIIDLLSITKISGGKSTAEVFYHNIKLKSINIGNNKAVAAVISGINNANFIVVAVEEHIKPVVKQIHLQNRLVNALRLEDNFL